MKNNKFILTIILTLCILSELLAQKEKDYTSYHQDIINAEVLITQNKYSDALSIFETVFNSYDYIFLNDYKIATQLSLYLGDSEKAFHFLRLGISDGWTLKEVNKNKFLKSLRNAGEWDIIKLQYDSLRNAYEKTLNQVLRTEVHEMFKKDQKLALANLFKIGKKAKERFINKKFIPQSEKQMERISEILQKHGYLGEKLIGNSVWMSTILSHHNSTTTAYTQKDTIYPAMKKYLFQAIRNGELSPYDYAIIEDWYITVKSERKEGAYGFINTLTEQELPKSNKLRQEIGMRSIEVRNHLVDIQDQTGMNFYLAGDGWVSGKITAVGNR